MLKDADRDLLSLYEELPFLSDERSVVVHLHLIKKTTLTSYPLRAEHQQQVQGGLRQPWTPAWVPLFRQPPKPEWSGNLLHWLVDRGFVHAVREVLTAMVDVARHAEMSATYGHKNDDAGQQEAALNGAASIFTNTSPSFGVSPSSFSVVPQPALEIQSFLDCRNQDGHTPLHLAVENGTSTLVRLLLVHGASPWVPTLDGKLPYQIAVARYRVLDAEIKKLVHSTGRPFENIDPSATSDQTNQVSRTVLQRQMYADCLQDTSVILSMLEGYRQQFHQTEAQQNQLQGATAVPELPILHTSTALWESQSTIETLMSGDWRNSIRSAQHRSTRSALFTSLAHDILDSANFFHPIQTSDRKTDVHGRPTTESETKLRTGREAASRTPNPPVAAPHPHPPVPQPHGVQHQERRRRIQVFAVRLLLAALSHDEWNEAAAELLLKVLHDDGGSPTSQQQSIMFGRLLHEEIKQSFYNVQPRETLLGRIVSLRRQQEGASNPGKPPGAVGELVREPNRVSALVALANDSLAANPKTKGEGPSTVGVQSYQELLPDLSSPNRRFLEDNDGGGAGAMGFQSTAGVGLEAGIQKVLVTFPTLSSRLSTTSKDINNPHEDSDDLWVSIPYQYPIESAYFGVVAHCTAPGFPFQAGELVVFTPQARGVSGLTMIKPKFTSMVRGVTTTLVVPGSHAPHTVGEPVSPNQLKSPLSESSSSRGATEVTAEFVRVWGIPLASQSVYSSSLTHRHQHWDFFHLEELFQSDSLWTPLRHLLRSRNGESLWVQTIDEGAVFASIPLFLANLFRECVSDNGIRWGRVVFPAVSPLASPLPLGHYLYFDAATLRYLGTLPLSR